MKKFQYKTIEMKLKTKGFFGFGQKEAVGFEETLNREGSDGWKYVDTLTGMGVYGESTHIKLIFEKEIES